MSQKTTHLTDKLTQIVLDCSHIHMKIKAIQILPNNMPPIHTIYKYRNVIMTKLFNISISEKVHIGKAHNYTCGIVLYDMSDKHGHDRSILLYLSGSIVDGIIVLIKHDQNYHKLHNNPREQRYPTSRSFLFLFPRMSLSLSSSRDLSANLRRRICSASCRCRLSSSSISSPVSPRRLSSATKAASFVSWVCHG